MPRFDWHKERAVEKLTALALMVLPITVWGIVAFLKIWR